MLSLEHARRYTSDCEDVHSEKYFSLLACITIKPIASSVLMCTIPSLSCMGNRQPNFPTTWLMECHAAIITHSTWQKNCTHSCELLSFCFEQPGFLARKEHAVSKIQSCNSSGCGKLGGWQFVAIDQLQGKVPPLAAAFLNSNADSNLVEHLGSIRQINQNHN